MSHLDLLAKPHAEGSLPFESFRKESSFNLGSAETKLLYTLHWLLLDAADECMLESEGAGKLDKGPFAYLYPLSAITVSSKYFTF